VGRFRLPFAREQLVSAADQLAVERSLVSWNLGTGRSDGIELTYAGEQFKIQGTWDDGGEDRVGNVNLTGITPGVTNMIALTEDVEWSFTGRGEWLFAGNWKQFQDLTSPPGEEFGMLLGLAGHAQHAEANGAPSFSSQTEWYAVTADMSLEFGGANVFASFFWEYLDASNFEINILAFTLQGGFFIAPKWELFGRFEWGQWDFNQDAIERSDMSAITFGVNYYIDGQDLKWSADLGFSLTQIEDVWAFEQGNTSGLAGIPGWRRDIDPPQVVFRTQLQLAF
jgi:hypothetical protein